MPIISRLRGRAKNEASPLRSCLFCASDPRPSACSHPEVQAARVIQGSRAQTTGIEVGKDERAKSLHPKQSVLYLGADVRWGGSWSGEITHRIGKAQGARARPTPKVFRSE